VYESCRGRRNDRDIVLGGSSKAAAERAARLTDGFRPVVPGLMQDYADAVERLGRPRPAVPAGGGGGYLFLHVTRDPEGDWAKIAPHALHENNDYAQWLEGVPNPVYHHVTDPDELRASGVYRIVTPEQCLDLARRDWSAEVLDVLDIPPAWLPTTYEGPAVTGHVAAPQVAVDQGGRFRVDVQPAVETLEERLKDVLMTC